MKPVLFAAASLALTGCAGLPDTPAPEQGGVYMIVLGKVLDRPAFMAGYAARLPPLYERYGGQYVAVSGNTGVLEGAPGFESVVIARWPSEAAARAFWTSPEYVDLIRARTDNNWGEFTVVLVPALPAQAAPAPGRKAGARKPE